MSDDIELSRRQILGGIATIGAAGAATGAGTISAWSDEVTLGSDADSTVSTGEVELGSSTDLVIENDSKLAPGDTFSGTVAVKYTGTLDANLVVDMSLTEASESTDDEDMTADEFASKLQLVDSTEDNRVVYEKPGGSAHVYDYLTTSGGWQKENDELDAANLAELQDQIAALDGPYIDSGTSGGPLSKDEVVKFEITCRVPEDVSDAAENESVEIGFTFTAEQAGTGS
jgi:hypothetical protein